MNWQAKIFGLVAISALFLWNCERDDLTVGLPPQEGIFETNYFEYTPVAKTFMFDSIISGANSRLLTGSYVDPYFGQISSVGYAKIQYLNSDIGANHEYDSGYVDIVFDYLHGVSPSTTLKLDIYWLDSITVAETYPLLVTNFSNKQVAYDSLWMSTSFYRDLDNVEGDYQDTVRIWFQNDFGKDLFDYLKTKDVKDSVKNPEGELMPVYYTSTEKLGSKIPGLAFVGTSNNSILGISASRVKFGLYGSDTTETATQKKFEFGLSSNSNHNYITPNFEQIDRTGAELEMLTTADVPMDMPSGNIYFQYNTGVNVVLDFSELYQFTSDTLTEVFKITNAVLEFSNLIESVDHEFINKPTAFEMFLTDDALNLKKSQRGVRRKIFSNYPSDSISMVDIISESNIPPAYFQYNEDLSKFSVDITLFIQSLVDNNADLSKVYLGVVGEVSNTNFKQLVLNKNDVKLKVYYTKRLEEQK